jgi:hypothetical protein
MTQLLMIQDDPEMRPLLKDCFEEVASREEETFSSFALRMQRRSHRNGNSENRKKVNFYDQFIWGEDQSTFLSDL